jgi:NitT/TauT family transport system substrate-binding protein
MSALVAGACGAGGTNGPATDGPAELTEITFVTDFGFAGRHAYYFVADEAGYYEEAGLSVTFERGSGSADAIRQVAAGQADLGFADTGTLVLSRANDDVDVQLGAIVYQDLPWAIMVLEESDIEEPTDLEGATLADVPGSSMIALFPLFADAAGFDADAVTWSTADGGALAGMLAAGAADGIGMPTIGEALVERAVEGRPLRVFPFADHGLDAYANGIIFSEQLAAENPDLIRAFIGATLRGMEDAFANPEEAGRIMNSRIPEVDAGVAAAETAAVANLAQHPLTDASGLGYIDRERMETTVQLISGAFELGREVTVDEMFVEGLTPAP